MSDKLTILYVDDEETNLFLFKAAFRDKFNVITGKSGMEGLERLKENQDIVVVISDMNMPMMNGVEFVRKAKENHSNVAYFILTGYDYNDEIDEALKNNEIHKFFTKPFDVDLIDSAVQEAYQNTN